MHLSLKVASERNNQGTYYLQLQNDAISLTLSYLGCFLKFPAILFLFWFAKVGSFNSWLLPKLVPFCKQKHWEFPLFFARFARNVVKCILSFLDSFERQNVDIYTIMSCLSIWLSPLQKGKKKCYVWSFCSLWPSLAPFFQSLRLYMTRTIHILKWHNSLLL